MSEATITDEHPIAEAELESSLHRAFNGESANREINPRSISVLMGYYTVLLALAIALLIMLILRQDNVKPALLCDGRLCGRRRCCWNCVVSDPNAFQILH